MLSRIINKTPIENEYSNIYEIESVDKNLINKIINTRFIGEGVYSIEQLSLSDDYKEIYLTTPSFDKFDFHPTDKEWQLDKEAAPYELILEKLSFLPLDVKKSVKLFDSLAEINHPIFIQVLLCKRKDSWRESRINQIEQYLNGSDTPINSKLIAGLQLNFINVLSKIGQFNIKRDPIEEIDNKLLQDNFRFECRIVILDKKNEHTCINRINRILDELKLFNQLVPKRVKDAKNVSKLINRRMFKSEYVDQMLSEQELYSLLCESREVSQPTVPVKVNSPNLVKSIQKSHYIESATKLLPIKEKVNEHLDDKKLEQLKYAFKRVKITDEPLNILDVFQGTTLIKVKLEIPKNVNYSNIKKNLENIQAALGDESISVEIGDEPDTINIFLPRENRDTLYLRSILESKDFQEYCQNAKLPFIIGENTNGELLFGCLSDLKHLMVTGATGSGKSKFLNVIIISLLLTVPPELLNLVLIDPKKVELNAYLGMPQVSKFVSDPKAAVDTLGSLVNEMDRRYTLFSNVGVRNIDQYNKNNEKKLPFIVVVIDEYADLHDVNPDVEAHLVRLGQLARASGIHIILATQKPLATIVTSVLKSNLPSAISFRLKTSSDYMTVFGKGIPYNLLGKGDGVARLENQKKEYERFQSPVISLDDNEEVEIIEQLKEVFKNVPQQELEIIVEDEPIDKLRKIIAYTGETRVSELQAKMGIAIGKVTDLLKQLVDEEWLRREGKRYVINVDESELNKWRD